ncbi:succinylornithine transaminase [Escherichia coli]|nr:succinylornithine transaminase [Escherichia coli]
MSQPITRENFDEWMYLFTLRHPLYGTWRRFALVGSAGERVYRLRGWHCGERVGHAHPELREALNEQASKFWHTATVTPTSRYCDWRKN